MFFTRGPTTPSYASQPMRLCDEHINWNSTLKISSFFFLLKERKGLSALRIFNFINRPLTRNSPHKSFNTYMAALSECDTIIFGCV